MPPSPLQVGAADDQAEQNADRMADRALSAIRRQPLPHAHDAACGHVGRESLVDSRATAGAAGGALGTGVFDPESGPGQPALAHELAPGVQGDAGIHRKFSITPDRIEKARSLAGMAKGRVRADSLWRLADRLRAYSVERDEEEQLTLVNEMIAVAEAYIEKHKGKPNEKFRLVEDLLFEARGESGVIKAKLKYLASAAGSGDGVPALKYLEGGAKKTGIYAESMQIAGRDAGPAALDPSGRAEIAEKHAKKFGLTSAEIYALKRYTYADYEYINPAVSQSPAWMEKKRPEEFAADPVGLNEEGLLHGAMTASGVEKLPKRQGVVWRGLAISPDDFAENYEGKDEVTFAAFTSTSQDRATALDFSGNVKAATDIRLLLRIEVKSARDVAAFSVNTANEREWLLLPGSKFRIIEVQKHKEATPGHNALYGAKLVQVS